MSAARVSSAVAEPGGLGLQTLPLVLGGLDQAGGNAFGTAESTTRSRSRCSKSSANRFGSWPISITFSTIPNTPALSWAANESTIRRAASRG